MTRKRLLPARFSPLAAALALAACNGDKGADNLADGNDADPALTSALNDQILVDPNLANQSNRTAVRPPAQPAQAPYPTPAEGESGGEGKNCVDANRFDYNLRWTKDLSPDFPLYPGAQVVDAAANDSDGCHTRAVTFRTGDDWKSVLDWYHTRAVKAGYSSEHQIRQGDHVLAGARESDDGAFYLIVTPREDRTEVALIANRRR